MPGRRRMPLGLALLVAAGLCGCWYNTTGRSGASVGNIYIPFFEDETNGERIANLGATLTDLVVHEFQQDRSIRVYQAQGERSLASKELLGSIKHLSEAVLSRDPNEQREEYRVVVICSITYNDLKTGKTLWQDSNVTGDGNYYLEEGETGFRRAVDQGMQEILNRILDKTVRAW